MSRMPNREADLDVTVFGQAATKGSAVSFPARRGDGSTVTRNGKMVMIHKGADKRAAGWASGVAQTVAERMAQQGLPTAPKGVPVVLKMVFYRPRPAGHFGTGRNAGVLKSSAPALPTTKPDADKLARLILDALKGVAWHDDSQVTGALAWKEFGTPARVELRLWQLPATVHETQLPDSPLFAVATGL